MIDSTIYQITFTYPSKMGPLDCTISNEVLVEGSEDVAKVRVFLAEQGITEVSTRRYHAPDVLGVMRDLRHSLNQYPVRVEEVQP